MTGVTTVGARRAGGGLAGAPYVTNVPEAVALAAARRPGARRPRRERRGGAPGRLGRGGPRGPRDVPLEYLRGYLGPVPALVVGPGGCYYGNRPAYRVRDDLSELSSHVLRFLDDTGCSSPTSFRNHSRDVRGERGVLRHDGPASRRPRQVERLEAEHGCRVVGWSARLADRAGLAEDLDAADGYDVLLTELKAAAVDVRGRARRPRGARSCSWTTVPWSWRGPASSTPRWPRRSSLPRSERSAARRHRPRSAPPRTRATRSDDADDESARPHRSGSPTVSPACPSPRA